MKKIVEIDGMSCGHCAMRIEKALKTISGVNGVKVDLIGKFAEIDTSEDIEEGVIKGAVDAAGYQVLKVK